MNIDKRKTYYCVLDTETCNGIVMEDGSIDLTQSIVYDIGWQIIDKKGNVYTAHSFAVGEVFCGMKDLMKSAYYAQKIPAYWDDITKGTRTIKSLSNIRKILVSELEMFNCSIVSAHNASFDLRALNNTQRYLSKSKYRFFFPYGIEIWDTLKMANDTICKQAGYVTFCHENGYLTKHTKPRVRATAEILYRYISGDYSFNEEHQGLADVEIESVILTHCLRQHKKMRKALYK